MTLEERVAQLEKELAEIKVELESRPQIIRLADGSVTIAAESIHINGSCDVDCK